MGATVSRVSCIAMVCVVAAVGGLAGGQIETDSRGRVLGIRDGGEFLGARTDVYIVGHNWTGIRRIGHAESVRFEPGRPARWEGRLTRPEGGTARLEQTLDVAQGRFAVAVTAEADLDVQGVYLFVHVPVEPFRGGVVALDRAGGQPLTAVLPPEHAVTRFLDADAGRAARMRSSNGLQQLTLRLDRALPMQVQDGREWGSQQYDVFVRFHTGPLRAGQTARLTYDLAAKLVADTAPATLTLDASRAAYRFDGFGGNYVYGIGDPHTAHHLENLSIGWGRVGMSLHEWEPQNDNDDPAATDWAYFEGRDGDNSQVRREFRIAQELQRRGVPYAVSIWRVPAWMCTDPDTPADARQRRQIAPERMDELLESITAYLLHAKRKYGVEPDFLSFNEPELGVRVLLTAEEHADMLRRIGDRFQAAGLKTKLLLGDVAGRERYDYVQTALADPQAMRHVGAVAFHSWQRGPEHYEAWAQTAERLGLPLLVTEYGADPGAWEDGSFRTFRYALDEVRMVQELLLGARPQGLLIWELTSDYALTEPRRAADGATEWLPTHRFTFSRHFFNLTPRPGWALPISSDHPQVLATVFASADPAGSASPEGVAYVLHVANLASARAITIRGLPPDITSLRMVRSGETEALADAGTVPVHAGAVTIEVPALSLVTLSSPPPRGR